MATVAQAPGATCTPYSPTAKTSSGAALFTLQKRWLVDVGGNQVTELTESTTAESWAHSNVWLGGRLSATYDTVGLHFELADPLGTKRIQANMLGQVDETCTSLRPVGLAIEHCVY